MAGVRPAEDHPLYQEWLFAQKRLLKVSERLESMSHLPEGDMGLLGAHSEWRAAKALYEAVCRKLNEPSPNSN